MIMYSSDGEHDPYGGMDILLSLPGFTQKMEEDGPHFQGESPPRLSACTIIIIYTA
jgi:hypothetical protein